MRITTWEWRGGDRLPALAEEIHFAEPPDVVSAVRRLAGGVLAPTGVSSAWTALPRDRVAQNPHLIVRIRPIERYLRLTLNMISGERQEAGRAYDTLAESNMILAILEVIGASAGASLATQIFTRFAQALRATSLGARLLTVPRFAAGAVDRIARFTARVFGQNLTVSHLTRHAVEAILFDEWEEAIVDLFGESLRGSGVGRGVSASLAGVIATAVKLCGAEGRYRQRMASASSTSTPPTTPGVSSAVDELMRDLGEVRGRLERDVCQVGITHAFELLQTANHQFQQVKRMATRAADAARDGYSPGLLARLSLRGDALRELASTNVYHCMLADYWHHVAETMYRIYVHVAMTILSMRQVNPETVQRELERDPSLR